MLSLRQNQASGNNDLQRSIGLSRVLDKAVSAERALRKMRKQIHTECRNKKSWTCLPPLLQKIFQAEKAVHRLPPHLSCCQVPGRHQKL